MKVGVPKETRQDETRVAISPEVVKKLIKRGLEVCIEQSAGLLAGYSDEEYASFGAKLVDNTEAWGADIVFKINPPTDDESNKLSQGALLISLLEPYSNADLVQKLADAKVNAIGMESVPRTSRAQSMDVLSSQANIAGYRAVVEAATQFNRFFPLMMTSAGSAKPARVAILGAGVAGLQAIATARRLGANVEAYDVRAEVKEQIESLGARFLELEVEEEGSGEGGYAKELSAEAKKKQQELLTEKLKKFDIVITTANIPGKKAPELVLEEAVKGMRIGSVIVDMAAANGGNCVLSKADETVEVHGVKIVGITNYPALMAADSSNFYARNLYNILELMLEGEGAEVTLNINLEDDIIEGALLSYNGENRMGR